MTDDEAERTLASEDPVTDEDRRVSTGAGAANTDSTVDRAAGSFVDLEQDLQGLTGRGGRLVGIAEDVERVPATSVPAGYPITITTEQALRLRVRSDEHGGSDDDADEVGDDIAVPDSVYLEWPPGDGGPLARLLALRGIDPDRFADLHGERIPIAIENGYLVPRLPPSGPRGSPTGVYGILAGIATNVATLAIASAGVGLATASLPMLVVLVVVPLVILSLSTYVDAWHLLSTTDWEGGPLFWATLALVPGINVVSSLAYLYARTTAEPL